MWLTVFVLTNVKETLVVSSPFLRASVIERRYDHLLGRPVNAYALGVFGTV
jgi:hypothetical protein